VRDVAGAAHRSAPLTPATFISALRRPAIYAQTSGEGAGLAAGSGGEGSDRARGSITNATVTRTDVAGPPARSSIGGPSATPCPAPDTGLGSAA